MSYFSTLYLNFYFLLLEYADWQQTIAENEQMNFEHLKYLHNNRDFYTTALQSLKDYAYKLAILGLEMDDRK